MFGGFSWDGAESGAVGGCVSGYGTERHAVSAGRQVGPEAPVIPPKATRDGGAACQTSANRGIVVRRRRRQWTRTNAVHAMQGRRGGFEASEPGMAGDPSQSPLPGSAPLESEVPGGACWARLSRYFADTSCSSATLNRSTVSLTASGSYKAATSVSR